MLPTGVTKGMHATVPIRQRKLNIGGQGKSLLTLVVAVNAPITLVVIVNPHNICGGPKKMFAQDPINIKDGPVGSTIILARMLKK